MLLPLPHTHPHPPPGCPPACPHISPRLPSKQGGRDIGFNARDFQPGLQVPAAGLLFPSPPEGLLFCVVGFRVTFLFGGKRALPLNKTSRGGL